MSPRLPKRMRVALEAPPASFLARRPAQVHVNDSDGADAPRQSYRAVLSQSVSTSAEWGIAFAEAQLNERVYDLDLWQAVCQGWQSARPRAEEWKRILSLIERDGFPREWCYTSLELIVNACRRDENGITEAVMSFAQSAVERIWNRAYYDTPAEETFHTDWLTTAINDPGGKVAEFWLLRLSSARASNAAWQRINPDISAPLTSAMQNSGSAAASLRIVFASRLHYFFSLDPAFTEAELLPLFDWRVSAVRAEQSWHGFLIWGRWVPGFLDNLLPSFNETLKRIREMPSSIREAAMNHVAGLALFIISDPLENNWITTVLQQLEEPELERLAWKIRFDMKEAGEAICEPIWERWMKRYLEIRLLGAPRPLRGQEACYTACWAFSVGRHFPEAVKLVQTMEVVPEPDTVFFELAERGLAASPRERRGYHPTVT